VPSVELCYANLIARMNNGQGSRVERVGDSEIEGHCIHFALIQENRPSHFFLAPLGYILRLEGGTRFHSKDQLDCRVERACI
jgi:hypothetical protein